MTFGLQLLGGVLVLLVSWWIGWRVYLHFVLKRGGYGRRCIFCGRYYRGNPTYCPHCGEVVSRWSNRR